MNSDWIISNPAAGELVAQGVIDPQRVVEIHPRCRDSKIPVLRCESSGVIFLASAEETAGDYYSHADPQNPARLGRTSNPPSINDLQRRADLIHSFVEGRRWADIGAGSGDLLLSPRLALSARGIVAVEPNLGHLSSMRARGIEAWPSVTALESDCSEPFGIVTLFHVLEHLHQPLASLRKLQALMENMATLVVEVPHARDVLLETFDNAAFKDFTFWSQHLVLHTQQSLSSIVTAAGFHVNEIRQEQRYPLANHLRWLSHGEPGGQVSFSHLDDPLLEEAYVCKLSELDQTDTLICIASVNNER